MRRSIQKGCPAEGFGLAGGEGTWETSEKELVPRASHKERSSVLTRTLLKGLRKSQCRGVESASHLGSAAKKLEENSLRTNIRTLMLFLEKLKDN